MKTFFEIDQENNGTYIQLLSAIAKLSGLFSDNVIPFINYRVVENIFCKSFNAINLSRSDTAFDAKYESLGIGLKTFICPSGNSLEKIAEFNQLSSELRQLGGIELAFKLAKYRNERIDLAKRAYNIDTSIYHIVARKENEIILFETDYDNIDIANVQLTKKQEKSLQFSDGKNDYSFNYSKSTLYRKFTVPNSTNSLPIEIFKDPFDLLLKFVHEFKAISVREKPLAGSNYVVLPLYSMKNKQRHVFEKSGLNQWCASGRPRDFGEVYIRIPREIHKISPGFFPDKNIKFKLKIPTGEIFNAKVCQAGEKALMTDPNKALSDWLLRNILKLNEGELATIGKLDILGLDSVIVVKEENQYSIDIMKTLSYEKFIKYKNYLLKK